MRHRRQLDSLTPMDETPLATPAAGDGMPIDDGGMQTTVVGSQLLAVNPSASTSDCGGDGHFQAETYCPLQQQKAAR